MTPAPVAGGADAPADGAGADDFSFGGGGFARVYGDKLAESSLLDCDVATRWVFVFMLARADAEGRFRCASLRGLARAAAVTTEQAKRGVEELEAPDPESTTPDEDGRRIIRIPGGWRVVTHKLHRDYQTKRQRDDAERQRRHRDKAHPKRDVSHDLTVRSAPYVKRHTSDTNGDGETDARRARLRSLVLEMAKHDPQRRSTSELMKLVTAFDRDGERVGGVSDPRRLSPQRLDLSINDAEEQLARWKGARDGA